MRVLGAIVIALMAMLFVLIPTMFGVCLLALATESVGVAWVGGLLSLFFSLYVGYRCATAIIDDTSEDHAKSSRSVRSMMDVYDVSKKPNAHEDCEAGGQGSTDSPDK